MHEHIHGCYTNCVSPRGTCFSGRLTSHEGARSQTAALQMLSANLMTANIPYTQHAEWPAFMECDTLKSGQKSLTLKEFHLLLQYRDQVHTATGQHHVK